MSAAPLPRRVRIGYALGSVATGSFGTVPGLLLLPYLTDTLGIAAALAGLIVLLPKALDVLLNPVAGRISDRHVSPLGPRRPFLLRGGLALAACFAVLFAAPAFDSKVAGASWVLLAFVGCATAYAFFQVPYIAMPAEITGDYTERTRLMSWRVAFLTLAILISGGASPAIRDAIGGRDGYRAMGLTVAALLVLGTVGAYYGTRRAPIGPAQETTGTLRDQLRVVAQAADFRWLLSTLMLQALAIGSMLAGIDYLARYVLGDPGAASIGFVCVVGPALLVSPLWLAFGNKFGKKTGYAAASAVLGLGAIALTAANHLPAWCVYAATGIVGIGFTGAQVFPLAMLPDVAAVDAARSGVRRAGVFTGIWTAGETLGLALGPGVYALVLAAGGYVSSTDQAAVQPGSAVTAIVLGLSVVPAVLIAISFFTLSRYRLTPEEVLEAR
ncbi:Na+/melibiose symporter-like transporter [Kribbella amoyensis]|uniref:Na+/melibiose symporter-like transporter n=1 Tax=Kribbella amoyensis TaxID=996641 RepID=A0A561BYX6_9ACTN|nr:MFS transporter [Kribbella amoyensis]TWD84074.1 Na+/melibiose symporter-like transporter [Kribbella amoyensis]